MRKKNMFNEDTIMYHPDEAKGPEKKAKINISGTPRLEVHGKSKVLSSRSFAIGRDKGCGLIIADPKVSKFHAQITFKRGVGYLRDSGSTNGTYLNGDRLVERKNYPLNNGDKISVGKTELFYYKD